MRNLKVEDKQFRMAQELLYPTPDSFPLGIGRFCAAPDNCEKQFRLKAR
jgi:hypothetical protein